MCVSAAGFALLMLAAPRPLPGVDVISVLEKAQASLVARNANCRIDCTVLQFAQAEDGSWSNLREVTNAWRFVGPRQALDATERDSDGRSVETRYLFDGTTAKRLVTRESSTHGYVTAEPRVFTSRFGQFLLTGQLRVVGAKDAHPVSIYEQLLHEADRESLAATAVRDANGTELIRVVGQMAWADYEVWIDPDREYNLVKFMANTETLPILKASSHYELDFVELERMNGRWFPVRTAMTHVLFPEMDDPSVPKQVVAREETIIHAVSPLSPADAAELSDFDWPAGTRVVDAVAGYTYTQLEAGRLRNPLDQMVREVLIDRQAVGRGNADPEKDRSDATLDELAALGIRLESEDQKVSLPPSVCAIGCAYLILKLEGHADLTTGQLLEELKHFPSGRVMPSILVDTLRSRGLAVKSMAALDADSLRQADNRDGLYVILLTGSKASKPESLLTHAMLYQRTADNGDCIVVSPPYLSRYRPESLRESWRGGYALVVARNSTILDEFVDAVGAPAWASLFGAVSVGLGVMIGGVGLRLLWRRLTRKWMATPALT